MNGNIKLIKSEPPKTTTHGTYLYLWDMTKEEREKRMNQIRTDLRNEGHDGQGERTA